MKTLCKLAILVIPFLSVGCAGFRAVNNKNGTYISDTTNSVGRTEVWGPNRFHVIRDVKQDASTVNRETINAAGNTAVKLGLGAGGAVVMPLK